MGARWQRRPSAVSGPPADAFERPPAGWEVGLRPGAVQIEGFTVLRDGAEALKSKPCARSILVGDCDHVGSFYPLCAGEWEAREAAQRELARPDDRPAILRERRWIHPIRLSSRAVYDLRPVLTPQQANFVREELFLGFGEEEEAWRLAKARACDGIYLPSDPPTVFVFQQQIPNVLSVGEPHPRPERVPPVESP